MGHGDTSHGVSTHGLQHGPEQVASNYDPLADQKDGGKNDAKQPQASEILREVFDLAESERFPAPPAPIISGNAAIINYIITNKNLGPGMNTAWYEFVDTSGQGNQTTINSRIRKATAALQQLRPIRFEDLQNLLHAEFDKRSEELERKIEEVHPFGIRSWVEFRDRIRNKNNILVLGDKDIPTRRAMTAQTLDKWIEENLPLAVNKVEALTREISGITQVSPGSSISGEEEAAATKAVATRLTELQNEKASQQDSIKFAKLAREYIPIEFIMAPSDALDRYFAQQKEGTEKRSKGFDPGRDPVFKFGYRNKGYGPHLNKTGISVDAPHLQDINNQGQDFAICIKAAMSNSYIIKQNWIARIFGTNKDEITNSADQAAIFLAERKMIRGSVTAKEGEGTYCKLSLNEKRYMPVITSQEINARGNNISDMSGEIDTRADQFKKQLINGQHLILSKMLVVKAEGIEEDGPNGTDKFIGKGASRTWATIFARFLPTFAEFFPLTAPIFLTTRFVIKKKAVDNHPWVKGVKNPDAAADDKEAKPKKAMKFGKWLAWSTIFTAVGAAVGVATFGVGWAPLLYGAATGFAIPNTAVAVLKVGKGCAVALATIGIVGAGLVTVVLVKHGDKVKQAAVDQALGLKNEVQKGMFDRFWESIGFSSKSQPVATPAPAALTEAERKAARMRFKNVAPATTAPDSSPSAPEASPTPIRARKAQLPDGASISKDFRRFWAEVKVVPTRRPAARGESYKDALAKEELNKNVTRQIS